jgi:2-oxoglutarate ferredoxin oxidoreductase subunit gamma
MTEYLMAGFGGQGILFLGKLLAQIGMDGGKNVSWLPSYGPAMRGGTCNCSVVISDSGIGSPLILEPDVLVVMNAPSYDKFATAVKSGGLIILDSTLIDVTASAKLDGAKVIAIPATQLAIDNNLKGMANIILLGALLKETHFADIAEVKKTIEKNTKKANLLELNYRALKLGLG